MHVQEINIKNQVYNYYFDSLVKTKMLENKTILTDKKNCRDILIYVIRYVYSKSVLS